MFRLVYLTFLGQSRDHHRWDHAHESPPVMTVPLWTLAALSIGSGFLLEHEGLFAKLVSFESGHGGGHEAAHAPVWLGAAAVAVFAAGLAAAHRLYGRGDLSLAKSLRERFALAADALEARYYFDDFFLWLVSLSDRLAAAMHWFDDQIVDAIFVDGWALVTRAVAEAHRFFDDFVVDGAVDGVGAVTRDGGGVLHRLVRGQVQEYLMYVALAMCLFTIILTTR